jgi:hypothetical protein
MKKQHVVGLAAAGLLLFLLGLGLGWNRAPVKTEVVTQVKEVEVIKEVEVVKEVIKVEQVRVAEKAKKVRRTEKTVTKADGTTEVTKTEDISSDTHVSENTQSEGKKDTTKATDTSRTTDTKTKTVTSSQANWIVSGIIGRKDLLQPAPQFGAQVQRRLAGPLWVGAYGLTGGNVGLSMGVEF